MANPFSAKNAKIRLNGTILTGVNWNVEEAADELDMSNFEGGGYSDADGGLLTARVTIETLLHQTPWDLNLNAGATLLNVTLYLNDTTGPSWIFPRFLVLQGTNAMQVREAGKFTVRGRNRGTYTRPTGLIA